MLTKPLTHLRPLLRLPTSSHTSPSPDLFSSNPSLLHHLPSGSSSQSLVSAQQANQAAGNASGSASGAGAGRAGWGAGSGNGGYTGHARAFLSLQHSSSIDPSSTMAMNQDDNRTQRPSLLLKHRLSKRTQVVIVEQDQVGRTIHRQIEARSGQRLGVVEIESVEAPHLRLESGEVPPARSGRRNSIAFPSRSSARVPSHPSTPSSSPRPALRSLPRSQSQLDIWQVGVPLSPVPARTFSTDHASESALIEEEDAPLEMVVKRIPPASTRIIGQPNRVLMDLAGVDLPGVIPRKSFFRRNSTAAIQQNAEDQVDSEIFEGTEENIPLEEAFQQHLYKASQGVAADQKVKALVDHYRSPRSATAFSDIAAKDSSLDLPALAPQHTAVGYTACLDALLKVRRTGESIAPMLEIYNEMLERDCVPSGASYTAIIRALCEREKDAWKAAAAWEEEKKWGQWKAKALGQEWDKIAAKDRDALIHGYVSEGNLDSAFKLYSASVLSEDGRTKLSTGAYDTLIETLALRRDHDETDRALEIMKYARSHRTVGNRYLLKGLLPVLARSGDLTTLRDEWSRFSEGDRDGLHQTPPLWLAKFRRQAIESESDQIADHRQKVWVAAVKAFIVAGDLDTALDIHAEMQQSESTKSIGPGAPKSTPAFDIEIACELAKVNSKKAVEFVAKRVDFSKLKGGSRSAWIDTLVYSGKFEDALKATEQGGNAPISPDTASRLYTALLSSTATSAQPAATEMLEIARRIRERSARFTFDLQQIQATLSILVSLSRYDLLGEAIANFSADGQRSSRARKNFVELVTSILGHINDDVPLGDLVTFARHLYPFQELMSAGVLPTTTVSKYLDARLKVSSAADLGLHKHQWRALIQYSAHLPADDGSFDDALVQLVQDLGELGDPQSNHVAMNSTDEREFSRHLVHRFGVERAIELLTSCFGPEKARRLASGIKAVRDVRDNDELSVPNFKLPQSPPMMPQALPDPRADRGSAPGDRQREPMHTLDRKLSKTIDMHTHRNSNMDANQAYDILQQEMRRHRRIPHPDSTARLLDNIARTGNEEGTRELYMLAQWTIEHFIPAQYKAMYWLAVENAMLIAACHLGHLEEAGMYRARMIENGMLPSADAYATMIACSKDSTDDALVARELFDESRALGVSPNLFLYNTIISKLSKARKAELALDLFKAMKQASINPSSVTYGAVINACCRVGDGESAAVLFDEMASRQDFRPRVPPFNTMMQFYLTTAPNRERVLFYYEQLRQFKVPPSAHTYKLLLDAYAILAPPRFDMMEHIFSDLCKDRRVPVAGTHWASLISAYGLYNDDVEKALTIFNGIPQHRTGAIDLATEPVVWESILNVLAQKGTTEQMDETRARMIEAGAKTTAYVNNVLISGYARHGLIDRARETFETMGDSVVGVAAPNNHPTLLTSSGHVKPSTVTSAPTDVVYREPSTYETMIRAELFNGNREAAEEVLKRMEARRYPVAVFMRARALFDEQIGAEGANWTRQYKSHPVDDTKVDVAYDAKAAIKADISAPLGSGKALSASSDSGSRESVPLTPLTDGGESIQSKGEAQSAPSTHSGEGSEAQEQKE